MRAQSSSLSGHLITVIPVYNGERYLRTTLEAVAQQTRRPDRVVILDNCSTDRTREIVEHFDPLRCEWHQNKNNIGLLGNLNRALEFSTDTDYLHLLMADDLVKPTFAEKLLAALASTQGRAIGYTLNEEIDQNGDVIGPAKRRPSGQARVVPKNIYLARQSQLATVLLPGVIFKTDRLPSPCLMRDFPQIADTLFLAEWATHCSTIVEVPEYLCQYRLHPFSATSKNIHSLRSWVRDEWRVMDMIYQWMQEPAFLHWLRGQKLRCLYAARSRVKMDLMRSQPDYVREIENVVVETVSPLHRWLGNLAVLVRDKFVRLSGGATTTDRLTAAIIRPTHSSAKS